MSKQQVVRTASNKAAFEKVRLRFLSAGLLEPGDGVATAIGVVSRMRGEGVTTICVGLARAVAASGSRVLLIDASGVGTRVQSILGLEQAPLTATDSKQDGVAVDRHVCRAQAFGFDTLAVSDVEPGESQWARTWAELSSRYDIVLVDTGSLEDGTAYRWRAVLKYSVLVMDPQRATYEILERFRANLERSALRLSGFVMNKRAYPVPSFMYRLAT